ncbi:MAG: hypothetical protein LBL26_14095 [Peptococcaceae bacterium]|jgi:hypothetical protein|nr:hypothetical protein [Peptococcaceae bacterium]
MESEKYVYVILSRSQTLLSRAIRALNGDQYTHAAISLDRRLEYMFSFGRRRACNPFVGCFKRESMDEGIYKAYHRIPGVVLEIPVTQSQYERIHLEIESFLLNSHNYDYNVSGLLGYMFNTAWEDDSRFFCSEFVYHILRKSGVCDWGKPRGSVRPQNLLNLNGRLIFEGNLKEYAYADAALPLTIGTGRRFFYSM